MAQKLNLDNSKRLKVAMRFGDTLSFSLQLRNKETQEILSLAGNTFLLQCYTGNYKQVFAINGQINGDNDRVTFVKNEWVGVSAGDYEYRIMRTAAGVLTILHGELIIE